MDFVDTAVKYEHITAVCNACLAQGRVLNNLNENEELYLYFLGEIGCSLSSGAINVCWECSAILRKVRHFQRQVQHAQIVLQQMLNEKGICPTPLSNLCKIKLENQNIVDSKTNFTFEESHQNSEEKEKYVAIQEIKENKDALADSKQILREHIMKEENYSDYDEDMEETSYYPDQNEFDASLKSLSPIEVSLENADHVNCIKPEVDIKIENLTETKDNIKKKRAPRGSLNVTFNNTATKSKNPDVDLNKYELCFKKTLLTEVQIENMGTVLSEKRKRWKEPKHYCHLCKKDFPTIVDFHRHETFCHILKGETPGPFKCLHCRKKCQDRTSLKEHWEEHNAVMACKLCDATFLAWRTNLREHVKTHAYFWSCKFCPGFKASYTVFSYHYRTIHKIAICDHCGKKCASKAGVLRHIKHHHMTPICKICGKIFKNSYRLRAHNLTWHPEVIDKAVDPECTYCVECNKQFPSAAKYKRHLYDSFLHNPAMADKYKKQRVPCPECGKVFARNQYMNNHYKLFHKKETKHYCELCDKYLLSAWALKKHIQGVHQKIREPKNKVCDICGTAFQTNEILKKHIRTHTGERPYKCAHCPAAFAQSSALNSHTRTQHKMA